MVWIRSPYLDPDCGSPDFGSDYFQNLTGTSLSKDTCAMKFSEWKNALSRNVEESFEKFLDPDPDDFQNLINSSLCTDTICDKIFGKIRSVAFR